jgi:hypothetical protein
MSELRLSEIPKKHIMKRWTLDARVVLPDHLKHYQKDVGQHETHTYMHSKMYIAALELVKMGDMNVAAYDAVMNSLIEAKHKVTPLSDKTDGMSLVEKEASIAKSTGQCVVRGSSKALSNGKSIVDSTVQGNSNEFSIGTSNKRGKKKSRQEAEVCSDIMNKDKMKYAMFEGSCDNGRADSSESLNDVYSPDGDHHELSAPPGKRRRGHPTTARDKAPYENKDKRSRFCTICRGKGNKCTTCPLRGDVPVKPRQLAKCSNCGIAGHRKTSCVKPMYFLG